MTAFSDLILAESSICNYYRLLEVHGGGTFGPNFSSSAGFAEDALVYSDDAFDTYHVASLTDFGFQWAVRGTTEYFLGLELDTSNFTIAAPAAWSVEFILRIDDNTQPLSIASLIDDDVNFGWDLIHDPAQGFIFYSNSGSPLLTVPNGGTVTFSDGSYHHIVLTYAEPNLIVYVDGASAATLSVAMGLTNAFGCQFTMGLSYNMSNTFQSFAGILDELVLYNAVLSSGSVTAHYNAAFTIAGEDHREVILNGYVLNPITFNLLPQYRGGNPYIDFKGDGQFERWRGGNSPVLDLSNKHNKIDVFLNGYIFTSSPRREVVLTASVLSEKTEEITVNGWVYGETSVVLTGFVSGTDLQRMYPRDSLSRSSPTVNRNFPLEP